MHSEDFDENRCSLSKNKGIKTERERKLNCSSRGSVAMRPIFDYTNKSSSTGNFSSIESSTLTI